MYLLGNDCNDENALVSSLATEICNAYDDDCDGLIDEEDDSWDSASGLTLYQDQDGDGNGATSNTTFSMYLLDGYTTVGGDCADLDSNLNILDIDGDGYTSCSNDCNDENFDPSLCNRAIF